ncbi:MAG: hypothetical protein K2H89_04330, partial [Oscillospiraceae bacterium]|nr:hypothetical protein [Oscillospiraceae bacterium]
MNNYQENQNPAQLPEIQPGIQRAVQIMPDGQDMPGLSTTHVHIMQDMREKYQMALTYCKAGNIPKAYQGRPADCMVAIDMAERMNIPVLMVMQSLYVVQGKPSWSGQACMSFIQAHPNFKDVRTIYTGKPGSAQRGCYIVAKRTSDNSEVYGVHVTIAMAQAEGWAKNPKWKNIPDLMLAYRAASFFARVHCPAVLMGVSVEG